MHSNKPIKRIKLGTIVASIFQHRTTDRTWYSVTLKRIYRTSSGWQLSDSLGCNDLLVAAKALDQAHTRIIKLQEQDRRERKTMDSLSDRLASPAVQNVYK